jgi:2-iminoacetate synthase ThiH
MAAIAIEEDALIDKTLAGERISREEARLLYRLPLMSLGNWQTAAAISRKRAAYGGRGEEIVTYIIDRNINYTNVCDVYCKFCAFYRIEKDPDHYVITLEELDRKLDELTAIGGVQILMQGGHHPDLQIDWYLRLLAHIRESIPISISTVSVRRSFSTFPSVSDAVEKCWRVQGSRAGQRAGRWRRDTRGPSETVNRTAQMFERSMARNHGPRA